MNKTHIIKTGIQGKLPKEVHDALISASRTSKSKPDSMEAVKAIDKVSVWARKKYPEFYLPKV
jgi:hypothetical protein